MRLRKDGRTAYILMWTVVTVCIISFLWVLHMNAEGEIDNSMLTVWASALSIIMTTCLLVYSSVYLTKSDSERYEEICHDGPDRIRKY